MTVAELFLGHVVFRGTSNNDMLYVFQQHLGSCPNRVIRQHLVQCQKFGASVARQPHFGATRAGATYHFLQQTMDPVTGTPVHKKLPLFVNNNSNSNNSSTNNLALVFPLATPLHQKLIQAKSAKDGRRMVQLFSDLLQQCLALDPTKRIALKDALRHAFFQPTHSQSRPPPQSEP